MGKRIMATLPTDNEELEPSVIKSLTDNFARKKAQVADWDAELNGGALVIVATILGKPLYMRVNHHDPELARHELAEMQSIVKDVVYPDYDDAVTDLRLDDPETKERS